MTYLGIDWGEKRIGLAVADELGVALPVPAAVERTEKERLRHIGDEIGRRDVAALVVGYPLNMDGSAGFKANEVDAFIAKLEKRFQLPVHRVDERLTSHAVEQGFKGRSKPDRRSGEVDSRAAALILQDFLQERGD